VEGYEIWVCSWFQEKNFLYRNKLLPTFYASFKGRAGANAPVMKKMFIAERDMQYNITVYIEKNEKQTPLSLV